MPQTRHESHQPSYRERALAADTVALAIAGALLLLVSPTPSPTGEIPTEPGEWSLAFSMFVLLVATVRGDREAPMRPELTEVVRQVVTTTAVAAVMAMTFRVFLANDPYVAAETVRHFMVLVLVLTATRSLLVHFEARARSSGASADNTLIVGAGPVGRRVAARLLEEPELGLRPVAYLDDMPHLAVAEGRGDALPFYPLDADLDELIARHEITQVIVAFPSSRDQPLPALVRRLWNMGLRVSIVPRLFELGGPQGPAVHLGGLPLTAFRADPRSGWRLRTKYALDRVVAFVALLLLSPLLIALAIAVRTSLGAPVLFRQMRVGNDGQQFEMLKFRTLLADPDGGEADASWAAGETGREAMDRAPVAPRTTRVSAFLRRYSLDELPQLWNVLCGHMSLIGPRPERVLYVQRFDEIIPSYAARHRVRSGLTGWAQVNGLRGATSLTDRVEFDNHYIEQWSPWLDLKIVLKTLPRVLRADAREVGLDAPA